MDNTKNENGEQPQIIVLNGVSSVGKTSVAKAIQNYAQKPFLHVQMDAFLEMLPRRAFESPDGLVFDRINSQTIDVKTGYIVEQALEGMRSAIASMAECGNNMVVDDVFFGNEDIEYRRLLRRHSLQLVGLFAPLSVVEDRERARGDRDIGLAKGQFERVHKDRNYDLSFDTSRKSPNQIASEICEVFTL